jgi:hypothetical protein
MSCPTRVYFVCSPHPRAGKTLGARLCAEFQSANARQVLGFDLGTHQPRFAEFLPTLATYASISDIRGQMALFDKLATGDCDSKVVDISHRAFESFFTIMRDFDFATEARRNAVSPVVLFIARLDEASIKSYTTLREWFPALTFVPVHNEAISRGRDLGRLFASSHRSIFPLQITQFSHGLQTLIDQPPFSFNDFRTRPAPGLSLDLRAELDGWVKRGWRQFRELELSLLMNEFKTSVAAFGQVAY